MIERQLLLRTRRTTTTGRGSFRRTMKRSSNSKRDDSGGVRFCQPSKKWTNLSGRQLHASLMYTAWKTKSVYANAARSFASSAYKHCDDRPMLGRMSVPFAMPRHCGELSWKMGTCRHRARLRSWRALCLPRVRRVQSLVPPGASKMTSSHTS